ncbi:helix-turn-helix domain-containing protein [Streptomyces sp. NPDC048603]|uniref:helix-turn-helix domain-containing protein n=1 Tax=Streptomyces sp. NPDC048603 TaxID=3365577 RepID=UPI003714B5EF
MSVDSDNDSDSGGREEPGWEVDPEDEQGAAVVASVGRNLKVWREAAGLRVAEFATRMGYGEDLVRKVESGKRIPRPEYLDKADEVLAAGGRLAAMRRDVEQARYPKRVRDLAKMEAQAVEIGVYSIHAIHGLLQTGEYAQALFETRWPSYSPEAVERGVAARVARQTVFDRNPAPALTFVQEEVTLRRPIGGPVVMRGQLERLLEVGQLRHVSIQVMPTDQGGHAGMTGYAEVLKFPDGSAVGRDESQVGGRPLTDPKHLRVLELRYGMIRAQALTPRESLAFIEQVLGET